MSKGEIWYNIVDGIDIDPGRLTLTDQFLLVDCSDNMTFEYAQLNSLESEFGVPVVIVGKNRPKVGDRPEGDGVALLSTAIAEKNVTWRMFAMHKNPRSASTHEARKQMRHTGFSADILNLKITEKVYKITNRGETETVEVSLLEYLIDDSLHTQGSLDWVVNAISSGSKNYVREHSVPNRVKPGMPIPIKGTVFDQARVKIK